MRQGREDGRVLPLSPEDLLQVAHRHEGRARYLTPAGNEGDGWFCAKKGGKSKIVRESADITAVREPERHHGKRE